jgi:cystathionine beta-lyase family protein involved in aluminum resistance
VARLFFESGLLYTLSIIASLGVYITGSELEYVATGAVRPSYSPFFFFEFAADHIQ